MREGPRLGRERLLDIERRLGPHRLAALAVLAVALIVTGPWVGWWPLVPLGLSGAAFVVANRIMKRSRRPHRWAAIAWGASPLAIGTSIAFTGGPESPAIAWLVLPTITLGIRFEPRGIVLGLGYTLSLLLGATVLVDPVAAFERPQLVISAAALVLAASALGGAIVRSERDFRRYAVLDPLTGLLNRAAFDRRAAELEQQAGESGEWVTCLSIDVDDFKRFNDDHGHAVGDAVLQGVAGRMRMALRAFDFIYRIGGDELQSSCRARPRIKRARSQSGCRPRSRTHGSRARRSRSPSAWQPRAAPSTSMICTRPRTRPCMRQSARAAGAVCPRLHMVERLMRRSAPEPRPRAVVFQVVAGRRALHHPEPR